MIVKKEVEAPEPGESQSDRDGPSTAEIAKPTDGESELNASVITVTVTQTARELQMEELLSLRLSERKSS